MRQLLLVIYLTIGSPLPVKTQATDDLTIFISKYLLEYPLFIVWNFESAKTEEVLSKVLRINNHKILTNADKMTAKIDNKFVDKYINYVILVYDIEELTNLLNKLSENRRWNTKMKHLIVLTKFETNDSTIKISFKQLWRYRVFNVVAVLYDINNLSYFTWYPYSKESNCGSKVIPKQFDMFLINPFANKIPKKIHGCPAKVLWKKLHNLVKDPFSINDPGALVELLRAIAKVVGITLVFDKQSNSIVTEEYVNRTKAVTLTKKVLEENVDIVGTLYGPSIFDMVDERLTLSSHLMYFASYWVIPFSSPLPLWSMLSKTFNAAEYVILLSTCLFSFFVWHVGRFQGAESIFDSFFSVTRMIFQRVVVSNTKTRNVVVILMIWMTFNVVNILNSRLVSLVTQPEFLRKPKTLEELADRGYSFVYREYLNQFLHARVPELAKKLDKKRIHGVVPESPEALGRLLNNFTYVTEFDTFAMSWLRNPWDLDILQEVV